MTMDIPSLFEAPPQSDTFVEERSSSQLIDLLYDGFYLLLLLKNNALPNNGKDFADRVTDFLRKFELKAQKAQHKPDDIFDAKYAICAAIDEAILKSTSELRSEWERKPLQLTLFGEQLAGEHFFDKLETARNGGSSRIESLEVFYMCLLVGFKGRYILEGPEKLSYLQHQLAEQIAHIKGKPPQFSPNWSRPDNIINIIKRETPLWLIATTLLIFSITAFVGFDWAITKASQEKIEKYSNIIQMARPTPSITITLP